MPSSSNITSKDSSRDSFNTSNTFNSTFSTPKRPSVQKPSKFIEKLRYDTPKKVEDSLHLEERMERNEMVVHAFEQYKRDYPKQWHKLNWEASSKYGSKTYVEPSEDDTASVHLPERETMEKEASEKKHKGHNHPTSPVKKNRQDKLTKGIAVAKKALCFGLLTPNE